MEREGGSRENFGSHESCCHRCPPFLSFSPPKSAFALTFFDLVLSISRMLHEHENIALHASYSPPYAAPRNINWKSTLFQLASHGKREGGSEKTTFLASCTTCKMAIFLSYFLPETIVLFMQHIWTPFKKTCIAPPPFDLHPFLDSRVKKRNNTTPPFPSSSKTQFPPNEIGHLPPFTSPR